MRRIIAIAAASALLFAAAAAVVAASSPSTAIASESETEIPGFDTIREWWEEHRSEVLDQAQEWLDKVESGEIQLPFGLQIPEGFVLPEIDVEETLPRLVPESAGTFGAPWCRALPDDFDADAFKQQLEERMAEMELRHQEFLDRVESGDIELPEGFDPDKLLPRSSMWSEFDIDEWVDMMENFECPDIPEGEGAIPSPGFHFGPFELPDGSEFPQLDADEWIHRFEGFELPDGFVFPEFDPDQWMQRFEGFEVPRGWTFLDDLDLDELRRQLEDFDLDEWRGRLEDGGFLGRFGGRGGFGSGLWFGPETGQSGVDTTETRA